MRPDKICGTALTAALVLALIPAAAGARPFGGNHPSPNDRCTVNANAAPDTLTAGDAVVVFGALRCHGGASPADQPVDLYAAEAGAGSFTLAQTTSTDAEGFYAFTFPSVSYSARFFVLSHGASSGVRSVRVAAEVTLSGPPEGTQLFTGRANRVTFTGTMNPVDAGARVILQRQSSATGNSWHRIGIGTVQVNGTYTIVHTFVVPSANGAGGLGEAGDASIRVLVRSHRRNIPSPSNILEYEISQAENPQLTLTSSANPIAYEHSTILSGVVAGVSKAPVTLLARSARQHGFAPIAEVTSDATGKYSFPAQSPLANTFYEVKSSGRVSAALFEGVKDVLTAQVSAPSIPAGQALTFSGTVSPDHSGHVIYLERQNTASGSFHVVELSTVGADSAYSIVHTVDEPGTKVFRVRIPGGPENEGAVSPPFTVQVTPASPSALTPESPGNSSMPAEGQV